MVLKGQKGCNWFKGSERVQLFFKGQNVNVLKGQKGYNCFFVRLCFGWGMCWYDAKDWQVSSCGCFDFS